MNCFISYFAYRNPLDWFWKSQKMLILNIFHRDTPPESFTLIERRSATKCRICICTFSHIFTKFAEILIVTVSFVPEFNGVSLPRHILRFPLLYDLSKNQQSAKKLKKPTNIHFLVGLYRGAKQHNFFFWEFKDQHCRKLSKPLFCWSSYNIRNFVCGLVTSTFF